MMYNKTVRECFFSPQHIGVIDVRHNLAVVFKNNQKNQGVIEFYMQCGRDGIIQKVCFKTNGNPYLIAGLEWLCRQLEGRMIDILPQIDYQLLIKELDIPVRQSPLALRIMNVFKESINLMNSKLVDKD